MRLGRRLLPAAFACAMVLGFVGEAASLPDASVVRLPASLDKIRASDRAALLVDLLDDGEAAFLVVLAPQADLRPASGLAGKEAKGRFVYDALRAMADATQPEVTALLRARGATVRPFIVVNAIGVRGNLQSLLYATQSEHTARIVADTPVKASLPDPEKRLADSPFVLPPSTVEWGVTDIGAPAVWSMGYTGTGIVVAGQDTGALWTHDALKNHYRGWDGASAEHDFNWHDAIHEGSGNPCGVNAAAPCDDNGHGTHTLGTLVGDDGAGNQIGVAPGAQWIACRNMNFGVGSPTTYLECFDWFLAPYPIGGTVANGDPARAPHVINNSWACPESEGCIIGQEVISGVLAMRAAGILTVVAAGNAGPACSTVNEAPAIYAESFSVGAYDEANLIAKFSSRGPVLLDGSGRMKPDIAAPGVDVRSAITPFANSYALVSGTSTAGPHVAGAAALLWNAAPYLIGEVELTEWVLRLSATPAFASQSCGGDTFSSRPNNVWGWGRLNVQAAVNATLSLTPTAALTFTVETPDTYVLDASASTDPETPADGLLARWDFGSDGVWDTPWSFGKVYTGSLTTLRPAVAVQIADPGGRMDTKAIALVKLNYRYDFPFIPYTK